MKLFKWTRGNEDSHIEQYIVLDWLYSVLSLPRGDFAEIDSGDDGTYRLCKDIRRAMEHFLTRQQIRVMNSYFGLSDGFPHPLSDIAAELRTSVNRAQQILSAAILRLRKLEPTIDLVGIGDVGVARIPTPYGDVVRLNGMDVAINRAGIWSLFNKHVLPRNHFASGGVESCGNCVAGTTGDTRSVRLAMPGHSRGCKRQARRLCGA